jgi:DNA helicase HerA-like ATPase
MTNLIDIEDKDQSKFRLIGNNVLSYRFAIPHDELLYIGDVLKITDAEKGMTFFAKVNDLVHDSNFSDRKWDTRPQGHHFYSQGEDVYLLADASPLGYVDASGKFNKPKTVPTKFSPVERPKAGDFAFLQQVMGEIEVGLMKTGTSVLEGVSVSLHSEILPQHMGVFATTGMGKSNFMKVFCASSMKARKFGVLMVDPHGEYVEGIPSSGGAVLGLCHYTGGKEGLSIFTTGSEDRRRKYSLQRLYLEYDDFRPGDLHLLFSLSGPQGEVVEMLETLEDAVSSEEIIDFFLETEFEGFDRKEYTGPYPEIARKLANFHPGTLSVIKRRIDILVGRNPFFRRKGSSIPDVLKALAENRVVLIDLPGMGERSELFILSVLTRTILAEHKRELGGWGSTESGETRRVLITIEEAQRVLGSGGRGTGVFRECAMEGRKFGVGLCVITQQPRNIDPRVLAQINTFVVMGLADRNDRATVAGSAKQDLSAMDTEIQTLDTGDAIISSLRIPFPVSARIHLFEDYVRRLNAEGEPSIRKGLKRTF